MNLLAEGYLIGVSAAASLAVSALFFKFWRRTHDLLFLAFSAAFLMEALNRSSLLLVDHPNEGTPLYYVVRLISFLLILAGILRKNYERN